MLTLSALHIYPVKSLAGIALNEARVQPRGLQYDRRWMLIDDQGRFVSQREVAGLTGLATAIEPPYLVVFAKKNPAWRIEIPLEPPAAFLQEVEVEIWDDRLTAAWLPGAVHEWFSDLLGCSLRLVYMPGSAERPVDPAHAPAGHHVSFADAYPFLLIGQASLDDLNSRLAEPLPMNRFRPNFVFRGGAPFEEDHWRDFTIGDVPFRGVKPCARCVLSTTDQETGIRGPEPLKTLSEYRRNGQKVLFGQNVIFTGSGEGAIVRVGDPVLSGGQLR